VVAQERASSRVGVEASRAVRARQEVGEVVEHPTVVRCRPAALREEAAVGAAVAAVPVAEGERGQGVGEGAGDVTVLRPAEQVARRVEITHVECVTLRGGGWRGAGVAGSVHAPSLVTRVPTLSSRCRKVSYGLRAVAWASSAYSW
jgi:hypothetical protein